MLTRMGARRWLAILLVVWGAVSVATAFITAKPQYVALRFLLGIAESGFFPGVIFYLTLWFPRSLRARVMALFMVATPLCNCIGSPISAHILLLHQGGLRGWQWLFVLEGAPAVLLGVLSWFVLVDGPTFASWLSPGERTQLAGELRDDESPHASGTSVWLHVARDSITYLLASVGFYGLTFWLPKILVGLGTTATASGWWAVPPYAAGAAAMIVFGRFRNRWWLPAFICFCSHRIYRTGRAPGLGRRHGQLCVRCHWNLRRAATFLGSHNCAYERQSRRSGHCDRQLRGRTGRLCRTGPDGMATRSHAHLLRRVVDDRAQHGAWLDRWLSEANLWRLTSPQSKVDLTLDSRSLQSPSGPADKLESA